MSEKNDSMPEASTSAPDYWPDRDGTVPACRGLWVKMVHQILSMTNAELAGDCVQRIATPFVELEDMEFYDLENHFGLYCRNALSSFHGAKIVETMGRRIIPTLQKVAPGVTEAQMKQLGMERSPQAACCSVSKVAYPEHNRGIGSGANVLKAENGIVVVEFDKMPHFCELWRGIFLGAVEAYDGQKMEVKETKCRRQIGEGEPAYHPNCEYGSSVCRFEVTWRTP